MKGHHALLSAVQLFVAGVAGIAAEGPAWTAKVDVQIVAVKPTEALTLLPELRDENTATPALEKLQKLVENEEGDLLEWPVALARSGTRATSESIEEVRYPTEFDPPQIPQIFGTKPPPEWRLHPLHVGRLWGAITPTAFETRNVGATLEIEPVVEENGQRIALNLVVRYVRFFKFHEFPGVKSVSGITGVMIQPEFACSTFTGSLTAPNGRRMLIGTFVEQKPEPRVILFLVRAEAMRGANQQSIQ